MRETFWSLLHDPAHWEFEIFLMLLFDVLIGALLWPFVKKHWDHHVARDKKERLEAPPELMPGCSYEILVNGRRATLTLHETKEEKEECLT